ncbi:MAG: transcription termination/antitermination protein NusG [Chloroflexota bacterium]|nr:transcription termination/antitermination protein NusG [Chloroflexota bacterium]MDE2970143.1 transcription termination/antitermination protein NusG [Chloroflexota bacterium]
MTTQENVDQMAEDTQGIPGGEEGHWYIVHCYSGMEDRVKKNLEQRIATMDVRNKIFEVVVPTEEVVEIKDGRRSPKRERLFPGYVLVRLNMDDQSWYVVRNTPGITGFISADEEGERKARPVPLTEKEVHNIFKRMVDTQPRAKVGLAKGQSVKVVDGPFSEFIGVVDEVMAEKGKVRVLVSFFGRETPVELDFLQAERIG